MTISNILTKASLIIFSLLSFQNTSYASNVRCDYAHLDNRYIVNTQIDSYNGNLWVTTRYQNGDKVLFKINKSYPDHAFEIMRVAQLAQILEMKVNICYYSSEIYTLMLSD